jgi:hypothetical protein
MTLKTLADVRQLIERYLPAETRKKSTWQHVAKQLAEAARGAVDPIHVTVALQIVFMLEGVECRPK